MSKNIPITARVNKGLFNSKNKVTEPLLSVGPAGVSGNNQTRNVPAPAKMMSSPLKKSEGVGSKITKSNEPKNAAIVTSTTKGTTTNVPGKTETKQVTIKKKYVGAVNDACSSVYIAKHGRSACDRYKKLPASKKGNTETKTITTQTPGSSTTTPDTEDKTKLTVMHEGDAMASWDRRSNDRAVIHTARKTKRAEIDLAKAEADKKGLTGKDRRDAIDKAKKDAKFNQAQAKVAGLTGSRDAAILQNQQSKKAGGTIKGTQLDYSKEQTMSATEATAANSADRAENYKAATGKTSTATSATTNPITETPKPAAGTLGTTEGKDVKKFAKPVVEANPDDVPAIATKKVNSFFNKKSPLKMKYFK